MVFQYTWCCICLCPCVHVCLSVFPDSPWSASTYQTQRVKTMTSHLVVIAMLAINLTTALLFCLQTTQSIGLKFEIWHWPGHWNQCVQLCFLLSVKKFNDVTWQQSQFQLVNQFWIIFLSYESLCLHIKKVSMCFTIFIYMKDQRGY